MLQCVSFQAGLLQKYTSNATLSCCCLPAPFTLAMEGIRSSHLWSTSQLFVHLASSAFTPMASVHKSRGDNVVHNYVGAVEGMMCVKKGE